MSKEGYEKVPDVEKGDAAPAAPSYDDLSGDQADLMKNMDSAIQMAKFDFTMPPVDPSELASQGESMLRSMLLPTVTAVTTMAGGLLLNYQAQYSSWAEMAIKFFPFVNAVIVFASSVMPLSKRCKDAIQPVFEKSDKVQDDVEEKVGDFAVQIDTTIDKIQGQVGKTLAPLKPTIETASSRAAPLKKIDPDLDIPDLDDIDREFDEMQGKVGGKVKSAQESLSVEKYIPGPLKSLDNFYWQVIFPVLCVALLLQLALAWISAAKSLQTSPPSTTTTTATRYLRGTSSLLFLDTNKFVAEPPLYRQHQDWLYDNVPEIHRQLKGTGDVEKAKAEAADQVADVQAQAGEASTAAKEKAEEIKDQAAEDLANVQDQAGEEFTAAKEKASAVKDDAKAQVDAAKDNAKAQVDAAKDDANAQIDAAKEKADAAKAEAVDKANQIKGDALDKIDQVKDQAAAAKNKAAAEMNQAKQDIAAKAEATKNQAKAAADATKQQANDELNQYKAEANAKAAEVSEQVDQYKSQAKGIIISVILSFLMSMLQMGLTFLFTSPKVKAFIVNMFMKQVSEEANRTLRETGVTNSVEDVMGTRMPRIRKKLLKIFKSVGKIKGLLDKIPHVPNIPGLGNAAQDAQDRMGDALKKGQKNSFLGKLFK